ncbi:Pycsar system effector family protein [Mucilaginibacter boryungensis]|uniref:Phosphohydrolase n=1 Tax=Mucilaginibacter boryungensis TaxID=768480 RepID=A0ABR9XEK6_9SPHI|nr:Pycsar system effector family protein [Mucilaginibacter boryungensis]MBE9665819.1 phosphohydrolase [Mucilaginibacter boryungensis]
MVNTIVDFDKLLRQVKKFVISYYRSYADPRYVYHNVGHTRDVVAAAKQIADHYQLNETDYFAVMTAAWFHDTGYVTGTTEHEEKSAVTAMDFLRGFELDEPILKNITDCILATKLPQAPQNLLQSIICDADLFHFGTSDFERKSKLLRQEFKELHNEDISKNDWRIKSVEMMEAHEYHTDYCRVLLNEGKERNLQLLKDKIEKVEDKKQKQAPAQKATGLAPDDKQIFSGEGNDKQELSKGVETMFRLTSTNHQRLSNMADSKAHIMISVNAIIISLLLSLLLRNIGAHHNQLIPAIMLLTVNLVTIVFSILATRPNISEGTFTQKNIEERDVNLLFFGNFYKMALDDYKAGMVTMIKDNEFLYSSLIIDVYSQGIVLGRKYRLLHIAYNVFMFGLVISVIAFVISASIK